MQENTQIDIPNKTQINPPELKPSKKPLILLIILFIFLISLMVLLLLLNIRREIQKKTASQLEISPTQILPTLSPTVSSTTPSPQIRIPLIVYLRDGNIWVVRGDGTSLRQITRDADPQNFSYLSPGFKSEEEITYTKCSHVQYECSIKNKNLETGEEKTELEPKLYLNAFSYDKEVKLLAYIAGSITGGQTLYFFENGEIKKVLDFELSLGRGGGLTDEVSLNFSPDDKYLLVVNTTTQPNQANDTTSIWVLDRNGNTVTKTAKEFATDAIWEGNTSFFYKAAGSVYRKNLAGGEQQLAEFEGYDLSLSSDKKKILFWNVSAEGETKAKLYSFEDKKIEEVKDGLAYPQWLNGEEIVAVRTTADTDSYLGFSTNGLVVYNRETGSERLLDSNPSIFQFTIQR